MSVPQASTTRQRGTKATSPTDKDTVNPTSLGTTSAKDVRRKKPVVDPPFWNMSMNRFLTYLTLSLLALLAFYTWRFTVWAKNAGGYWNLVTGKRVVEAPATGLGSEAMIKGAASAASAASAAGSAASSAGKKGAKAAAQGAKSSTGGSGSGQDVQSRIFELATALGVTPHDLTTAIRPLIDPSVPNPAEAAAKEIEMLKLQLANGGGGGVADAQAQAQAKLEAEKAAEPHAGVLGVLSEVLLD